MDSFFAYDNYGVFLDELSQKRAFVFFGDCTEQEAVILRHDIDFDVQAAYRIAKIEADHGVKSTFFFMLSCPFYNLAAHGNKGLLKEIKDLGHDIGLHFDPTVYPSSTGELEFVVKQEADWLSFLVGSEVKAVSLHNPSILGEYPLFDGFTNAYDQTVFNQECYVSDSCMDFRGKAPRDFIFSSAQPLIQLLLHPIHFSKEGNGYLPSMSSHVRFHVQSINEIFGVNKTFRNEFPLGLDLSILAD